jgi:hypothetical protein
MYCPSCYFAFVVQIMMKMAHVDGTRWLRGGARGGGGLQQQELRGLRLEEGNLRSAGAGEEAAVVLWLREGARGGGGPRSQDVRGLRPEDGKL